MSRSSNYYRPGDSPTTPRGPTPTKADQEAAGWYVVDYDGNPLDGPHDREADADASNVGRRLLTGHGVEYFSAQYLAAERAER
jgi:hypothetical protein